MRNTVAMCLLVMSVALVWGGAAMADPAPRVLVLVDEGFNSGEYEAPRAALLAAGYEVVVAAPAAGPVKSGNTGKPDAEAVIALGDAQADDYFALMIPGGHAPAKLAQIPEAVQLARGFSEKRKPIGAICHGPLLLLEAGVLTGRPFTALWSVKDELPALWVGTQTGRYIDLPTVRDGNVLTGRHVADLDVFAPDLLRHLQDTGGLKVPAKPLPILVFADTKSLSKHESWLLTHALRPANIEVSLVDAEVAPAVLDAEGPVYTVDGAVDAATLRGIGQQARLGYDGPWWGDELEKPTYDAALVLHDGFDGRSAAALKAFLEFKGKTVAVVAPAAGWVRGIQGTVLEADTTFADVELSDDAVLIAPGVTWPEPGGEEGEAESTNTQRMAWIVKRYAQGARVIAVGHDSYHFAQLSEVKDATFASSHQALWYFKRTGNKYSGEDAVLTSDRLVTTKGPDTLGAAMRLADGAFFTEP